MSVAEVVYLSNKYNDVAITSVITYSSVSLSIIWLLAWAINIRFVEKFPKHYLRFITIALYSLAVTLLWSIADGYLISYLDDLNFGKQELFWKQYHQYKAIILFLLIFIIVSTNILLALLQEKENILQHQIKAESLHKEAELYKLRQQFNAHFIFNSLNAINALIAKQPDDAKKMLITLSEYLRNNIKKEEDKKATLAEELQDLNHYLSIEKYRFANRLKIIENIEEECLSVPTPPFIIQPLIENAIKFGLYGTIGEVLITIDVKLINKHLEIIVCNPYDPTGVMPKGTGFGLTAVKRRLYILYQQNDLLKTEIILSEHSAIHQFKAILILPIPL